VKFGVHLPQWGPRATRDGVLAAARTAEEVGFESVWVADHVVYPMSSTSVYPFSARPPWAPEDGFLEALTTLACVAGATERVALGTSVLVLPMRSTLLTAKTLATLDVLSGGRLSIAVGAGWWSEEFTAVGERFAERGRHLDAQLAALTMLWKEGVGEFDSPTLSFAKVTCEPRPLRGGAIPLWIGGTSDAALARVVKFGYGWHAVGASAERLKAGIETIRKLALAAGRPCEAIRLSTTMSVPDARAAALARIATAAELGFEQIVVNFPTESVDELRRAITGFAEIMTRSPEGADA
jgi:probable F420-dependent oxidoreductase